ncbi:MAG: iron-containing alcohol dehydrogenase [Chloroflexi bacterium]|nr:MAG: iron-containing alcohol dehydrogenase [Chloroflexota bacterium]
MWYFRSPEIVFGPDSLDHLSQISGRRAMIVTDAVMVELGYARQVQEKLQAAGIESRVFADVEAEPAVETIRRGAAAMTEFSPDWIVGLGGGSPLDAAKAMWILYENPAVDILSVNPFEPLGLRQKARLIAVSATSGTGAEVSWGIVITDPADRRKAAFGSPENLPDIAIVDPALAATMPPQLTADTGMDALTHAVEGYVNTWQNDFSDGLCLNAVRLIFTWLPRAVAQPDNAKAREKMHNAAAIAGLGFINSMCSLAHAMGHSLGGLFDIPHGRAVGLLLPYTIEFAGREPSAAERYRQLAALLGLPAATATQGTGSLVQAIRQLLAEIGQPQSIGQALNISADTFEAQLETLVEHAESDTQIVTAVRPPETEDLRRLFRHAFLGQSINW